MDEELDQLEAELKRLRPVAASPELVKRVADGLRAEALPTRHRVWWLAASALPIAAAIALLLTFMPERRHAPDRSSPPAGVVGTTDVLKPVSVENVLYAATEEGLVTLEDGTPARRERLQFVDTIKWQNPRTHASLTYSVPREEVRVVPIRYQ